MTDGNGISNKTIVFYRQLFRSYNIFSCFTVSFIEVLFFGKIASVRRRCHDELSQLSKHRNKCCFRDIVGSHMLAQFSDKQIGGPGLTVEIDESLFGSFTFRIYIFLLPDCILIRQKKV